MSTCQEKKNKQDFEVQILVTDQSLTNRVFRSDAKTTSEAGNTSGTGVRRASRSAASISSDDSGFDDTGPGSTPLIETELLPYSFSNSLEPILEGINRSRGSPGSSQYVTAHTSLENSTASSVDNEVMSPQAPSVVGPWVCPSSDQCDNHKEPVSTSGVSDIEVDHPHPRRRPPLQTSQSVEYQDVTQRPRLRRKSRTEPRLPPDQLKEALIKLTIDQKELNKKHELILKETVKEKAVEFRDYIDLKVLHAHLFQEGLLNVSESEFLNSGSYTSFDKANKFLFETLNRKGPLAYRSFFYALYTEKGHSGHTYLADLLRKALVQKS